MSKTRNINRVATFDAIMKRSKEDIADQLAGILMLLYHEFQVEDQTYTAGWNDSRKAIRELFQCDDWVKREYKK